jgi:hypothetical protein
MKKFIFGLVLAFLTVTLFAQNTSDFDIQGNDDGTVTILNYKGLAKDIVIPEKIFNMPVSRLRENAFSGKGLTSIVIPNTVSYIGDSAFSANNLTRVTIPEAVEYIGDSAFYKNSLMSITIPGNVVIIGSRAFSGNKLTSITIPDSVIFIGNGAFESNQLTSITLGANVSYIGNDAFYRHKATSIIIPNSVVYIGKYAFTDNYGNSGTLTAITIGKYVMFGDDAFGNSFDENYKNNDKRAGKYTYVNKNWTYTPNP